MVMSGEWWVGAGGGHLGTHIADQISSAAISRTEQRVGFRNFELQQGYFSF
jgi:hypothetical protein